MVRTVVLGNNIEHHEQKPAWQTRFKEDVMKFQRIINNPFVQTIADDLMSLDT